MRIRIPLFITVVGLTLPNVYAFDIESIGSMISNNIVTVLFLVAIVGVALWLGRGMITKYFMSKKQKEHEELRERSSIKQMKLGMRRE